jgi:hypothetical protein
MTAPDGLDAITDDLALLLVAAQRQDHRLPGVPDALGRLKAALGLPEAARGDEAAEALRKAVRLAVEAEQRREMSERLKASWQPGGAARKAREASPAAGRPWTGQENEIITREDLTAEQKAEMTGRTIDAVHEQVMRLRKTRKRVVRPWTPEEIAIADDETLSAAEVGRRTGRSRDAVLQFRHRRRATLSGTQAEGTPAGGG